MCNSREKCLKILEGDCETAVGAQPLIENNR